MDCLKIESILSELKVNSRGSIRNKNKVIDKIYSEHLKKVNSELMDIRVFISKNSSKFNHKEFLFIIDNYIYNKQIQ